MKIKGIIRDKNIQLLENISIAEGTEVTVEIPESSLINQDSQWQKLQKVIGTWKDDSEIDKIFNDMDEERHKYRGRDLNFEDIK
jgi:hypothetical protein